MIDAKELRPGNVIYLNGKKSALDVNDIAFLGQCQRLGVNVEATPIKVTEETLVGTGFDFEFENMSDRVYAKEGIKIRFNKIEGLHLYVCGETTGKSFFYIHQLQNLWFCLTGSELTILP